MANRETTTNEPAMFLFNKIRDTPLKLIYTWLSYLAPIMVSGSVDKVQISWFEGEGKIFTS